MSAGPPRAEVVGSMLRPQRPRRARDEHAAGDLDDAALTRIEDEEVDRAIALRESAGMDVVTDGEFRREPFTGLLAEAVDGMGDVPAAGHDRLGADELSHARRRAITGRLGRRRPPSWEYDDERSGGFGPLADLPDDRVVVLGLVSTKGTELEDAGELLGRVEEAARPHARDRLGISPQCGFESAIGSYPLDEPGRERKPRLVAEVARRAWGA